MPRELHSASLEEVPRILGLLKCLQGAEPLRWCPLLGLEEPIQDPLELSPDDLRLGFEMYLSVADFHGQLGDGRRGGAMFVGHLRADFDHLDNQVVEIMLAETIPVSKWSL